MASICVNCPVKNKCSYFSERKTVCNLFENEKLIELCGEILKNKC